MDTASFTVSASNVDLTRQLKEIDESISQAAVRLTEIVQTLEFAAVMEFELNSEMTAIPEILSKKKGIYFFEIKNCFADLDKLSWATAFKQLWKASDVIWVPGVKDIRLNAHEVFNEWVPLYIGKSKNVGGRIYEHLHQVRDKTTFSMKLKARLNMHGLWLRVSWISLDVKNYDMIAPAIERMLRDKFNPITGKQ